MMAITVKIEIDDQGQVSVGEDQGDQNESGQMPMAGGMSEGQEDQGMKQVASVDEALAAAKQLLSQGPASAADQQVATGYARARGPAPGQPQMKPGMGM